LKQVPFREKMGEDKSFLQSLREIREDIGRSSRTIIHPGVVPDSRDCLYLQITPIVHGFKPKSVLGVDLRLLHGDELSLAACLVVPPSTRLPGANAPVISSVSKVSNKEDCLLSTKKIFLPLRVPCRIICQTIVLGKELNLEEKVSLQQLKFSRIKGSATQLFSYLVILQILVIVSWISPHIRDRQRRL